MVKVLKVSALALAVLVFTGCMFAFAEDDGKAVYDKQKCFVCHGKNGEGKACPPLNTKAFKEKYKDNEKLEALILKGSKPKKGMAMPAFKGKIKDSELDALVKFLLSLK